MENETTTLDPNRGTTGDEIQTGTEPAPEPPQANVPLGPPSDLQLIPAYQLTKIVKAFKVGKIEGCRIFSKDEQHSLDVSPEFISSYNFNSPGYIVMFPGHTTWLPAEVFEGEGLTSV